MHLEKHMKTINQDPRCLHRGYNLIILLNHHLFVDDSFSGLIVIQQ